MEGRGGGSTQGIHTARRRDTGGRAAGGGWAAAGDALMDEHRMQTLMAGLLGEGGSARGSRVRLETDAARADVSWAQRQSRERARRRGCACVCVCGGGCTIIKVARGREGETVRPGRGNAADVGTRSGEEELHRPVGVGRLNSSFWCWRSRLRAGARDAMEPCWWLAREHQNGRAEASSDASRGPQRPAEAAKGPFKALERPWMMLPACPSETSSPPPVRLFH